MRRVIGLTALLLIAVVATGAGWSSRVELGDDYRCTYINATNGDTLYFPRATYGVRNLGTGGGSAVADSSRAVRWLMWSQGPTAGTCSLAIFTDACPGGVDTVLATNSSFLSGGLYGGVRDRITKVYVMGGGSVQITGAD